MGVPRTFMLVPSAFGVAPAHGWHQPSNVAELVGMRAAEWQHAFSARVLHRLRVHPLRTQTALAAKAGLGYRRLNKGLRGHLTLTLVDLVGIEAALGLLLSDLQVKWTPIKDPELVRTFRPVPEAFDPGAALRAL